MSGEYIGKGAAFKHFYLGDFNMRKKSWWFGLLFLFVTFVP